MRKVIAIEGKSEKLIIERYNLSSHVDGGREMVNWILVNRLLQSFKNSSDLEVILPEKGYQFDYSYTGSPYLSRHGFKLTPSTTFFNNWDIQVVMINHRSIAIMNDIWTDPTLPEVPNGWKVAYIPVEVVMEIWNRRRLPGTLFPFRPKGEIIRVYFTDPDIKGGAICYDPRTKCLYSLYVIQKVVYDPLGEKPVKRIVRIMEEQSAYIIWKRDENPYHLSIYRSYIV